MIIREYIDRAISGTTDKRDQFQKMIVDSVRRQFEAVIIYSFDRFARNRYDSATYKARLIKNGVRVISVKENISDDPAGILMESVLEGMAGIIPEGKTWNCLVGKQMQVHWRSYAFGL